MLKKLTVKQERFAQEYVSRGSASEAYRVVYNASGMTDQAVHVCASRAKAKVGLRIKELQAMEAEKYSAYRSDVIKQWLNIATANVNELIQVRRESCSQCYPGERHLKPNPECKKCGGEGDAYIHIADTRTLTDPVRLLYAGAKKTRDGIEIFIRDQDAALVNLARAIGVFDRAEEKQTTEGIDLQKAMEKMIDPIEASKIYQKVMRGT